jgi:hypothetical protein
MFSTPVGASLLAMDVNDNADVLNKRVVLKFFASRLAPTEKHVDPNCIFYETEPCTKTIKS